MVLVAGTMPLIIFHMPAHKNRIEIRIGMFRHFHFHAVNTWHGHRNLCARMSMLLRVGKIRCQYEWAVGRATPVFLEKGHY